MLKDATAFNIPLTVPAHTETTTLIETTFPIGPLPVIIIGDVTASYGLDGEIDLGSPSRPA